MCSGDVSVDALLLLCNLADGTHGKLYSQLTGYLAPMRSDPVVPLLTFKDPLVCSLEELFAEADIEGGPETMARLLHAILMAQVAPTFHKINVHAAMTPSEIKKLFEPVFRQAKLLQDTYQQRKVQRGKEESLGKRRESTASRSSNISSASLNDPEMTPFVTVSTSHL